MDQRFNSTAVPLSTAGGYYGHQNCAEYSMASNGHPLMPSMKQEDAVISNVAVAAGRGNGMIKYCGVCGDIAKSYHFGGLSCDSCKAFFRRSVQNDNYVHFHCCHSGQCLITMGNRKSCQYCRMQRCFAIGMEKSWVMTEEERKALMKARAEKKLLKQMTEDQRVGSSSSNDDGIRHHRPSTCSSDETTTNSLSSGSEDYVPKIDRMTDYLQPLEIKEIESVVTKYLHAYHQVPYRSELRQHDESRPGGQIMEMFGTLIRRFAYYSRLMADFVSLPHSDQSILLKSACLEMCVLRGALVYDPVNGRWPNVNMAMYKDAPVLGASSITGMTSSHLFQMHMEFISSIQQMGVDEPTIMLLILIVLFTPERQGLQCADWIESFQSYYTVLLEHYMNWRFGRVRARIMFSKLLTKLSDLRQLSDNHNQQNLQLDSDAVSSIQYQLSGLKINPYRELKVVSEHGSLHMPAATDGHAHPATSQDKTHQYGHRNVAAPQPEHPPSESSKMMNMAMQFMQVMQKTVSQVVSAPNFGYEWAAPDYKFDLQADHQQRQTDAPDPSIAASSIEEEPVKPLTPGVMAELYDALEEYVDQVESEGMATELLQQAGW